MAPAGRIDRGIPSSSVAEGAARRGSPRRGPARGRRSGRADSRGQPGRRSSTAAQPSRRAGNCRRRPGGADRPSSRASGQRRRRSRPARPRPAAAAARRPRELRRRRRGPRGPARRAGRGCSRARRPPSRSATARATPRAWQSRTVSGSRSRSDSDPAGRGGAAVVAARHQSECVQDEEIGAALVADQVPPAAGPRRAPSGAAHGDRSRAGDHADAPALGRPGRDHEVAVVDQHQPGATRA